ncbi:helix-turn-helix transcriptional regulator [Pseudomonas piscis]|uniref:helix-turn-helix transcriptional regulator n=1 Tax=Pseudomonas piscis TaxID=2614538 RepID=UPI00384D2575
MKRSITSRANLGSSARIIHSQKPFTHRIHVEQSSLVAVWKGQSCLRWAGHELLVRPGEIVALASEQTFDVIHIPCPRSGFFEAQVLVCADPVVKAFLERRPRGRRINDAQLIQGGSEGLLASFRHAYAGFDEKLQLPQAIVTSRLTEMLTWLDHHGGYFATSSSNQITLRVRQLIGSDPGAIWTATMVARHLAMSEATLRRRLAAEGSHFQQLLLDVRMARALTLLQLTDLPIANIACEVGYSCSSRFSSRFRQRFGGSPSDMRSAAAFEPAA